MKSTAYCLQSSQSSPNLTHGEENCGVPEEGQAQLELLLAWNKSQTHRNGNQCQAFSFSTTGCTVTSINEVNEGRKEIFSSMAATKAEWME